MPNLLGSLNLFVRDARAHRLSAQKLSVRSRKYTNFFHVDVFASRSLTGNGLAVFLDTDGWSSSFMQQVTQEMRQFESIFLSEMGASGATARVFTVEEELPFAGHPVLGAAAVLHRQQHPESPSRTWSLKLPSGQIGVATSKTGRAYLAEMDQGEASIGATVTGPQLQPILDRLGLETTDLVDGLPATVISTGLPYLILPVRTESNHSGQHRCVSFLRSQCGVPG